MRVTNRYGFLEYQYLLSLFRYSKSSLDFGRSVTENKPQRADLVPRTSVMAKNKSKNPQPKASELKIIQSKVSKPNAPTSKSSKSAPIANHPAPAQNADQSVRRAEIVALLDILSRKLPTAATLVQVPEDLSENTPESTRQMSYEQEDRLVKELAFLSGISDNPNHIMAVCIQEFPKEGGCGILLAVNKSSPDTADPVLEKAQRGFQRIFDRLREISPSKSLCVAKVSDNTEIRRRRAPYQGNVLIC